MIGAQLIIGDLEEPFLEAALRSVEWVDYVIACCTAPDDNPIAQANWKKISDVVPLNKLRLIRLRDSHKALDFAAARNIALEAVPDGDFVLILDADEIHYPEWEDISQWYIANGADSVRAAFHHFVCYRDAVQAVYPREILFRKYPDTKFVGKVHEKLVTTRRNAATADYRYCHFGYLRPQPNVFERWRRYSVIEGEPNHYAGQSPEHIIDDRVSVSTRFKLEYPPVVRELIEQYPVCPVQLQGEPEIKSPHVALVALWTDADRENMEEMLQTLEMTSAPYDLYTVHVEPGDSLAASLNKGFREALGNENEYIGWIHPDMRFDDPEWLTELLHELRCWPNIGKVCAANTRDPIPEEIIPGHEQCYLIRASVLREIGLFDEGFIGIGGYEDWDLNRRIRNAGDRVVITPRAKVYHEGMGSRSRRDTNKEQLANAQYYEAKWGNRDAPV